MIKLISKAGLARRRALRCAAGIAAVTSLAAFAAFPVQAEPQDETLRVGVWNLPPTLGNPHSAAARPYIYTWPAIFDPLTVLDEDGVLKPNLVVSWELINDTTWRFKLRPGVEFHNGEVLTADAIVESVKYLSSENATRLSLGRTFRVLDHAEAIDDLTVDVHTKQPEPILARLFSALRPPPPKLWRDLGDVEFSKQPIGTGPFMVTSWTPGKIELVAAENTWRPAGVARMEIFGLPEEAARLQALLSDQVDIALGLNSDAFDQVEAAGHRMALTNAPGTRVLNFRSIPEDSPFHDKRVRQAMNFGVNLEAISENLHDGKSVRGGQVAKPGHFGHNPNIKPYTYDPDRAKALLAEAGYPDGFKAVAEIIASGAGGYTEIYQIMANDLLKIGVELELRQMTIPDLVGKLFGRAEWKGFAFDMDLDNSMGLDPVRVLINNSCGRFGSPWHCNKEAQPLINAAQVEMDLEKRDAILQKVAEMYHDDPPAIYLFEELDFDAVHKRVQGYVNVHRQIMYDRITFSE